MSTTTDTTDTADTTETTAEPSVPTTEPSRSTRTIVAGLLGIAIVIAGLWAIADVVGLIAAAVIALVWYRVSALYAVAFGHAAFLVFAPTATLSGFTLSPELLIAEGGLLVLLLAPAMDADAPSSLVVVTVAALCGLVAISVGGYWWSTELWIAAAVLMGALVGGGYTLYRYELVRLDLVGDDRTT